MESTRRTFLKHAASLSAACLVGLDAERVAHAAITPIAGADSAAKAAGWYDRPMRWAQLSFVEDDPGNYDLAFWLDYFQKIHAALPSIPPRFHSTIAVSGSRIWIRSEKSPGLAASSA